LADRFFVVLKTPSCFVLAGFFVASSRHKHLVPIAMKAQASGGSEQAYLIQLLPDPAG